MYCLDMNELAMKPLDDVMPFSHLSIDIRFLAHGRSAVNYVFALKMHHALNKVVVNSIIQIVI